MKRNYASERGIVDGRIAELKKEIAALPAGSITAKTINGKSYYYHRRTIDKKRVEKYIPFDEVELLRMQMEQRKLLEKELKELRSESYRSSYARGAFEDLKTNIDSLDRVSESASMYESTDTGIHDKTGVYENTSADVSTNMNAHAQVRTHEFSTNVRIGHTLRAFSASVHSLQKRECYCKLSDFIYSSMQDKVFVLYGLRRTGKTTLIRQILDEMNDDDLSRTAFIQVTAQNTLADVNRDLKCLEEYGYQTVFMDEVTLMEDFIQGAALFSDVFATCGMKLVLSGTDSLGFLFAEDEQLYDRCILLHTTFIPYQEFESVLGIRGIDEYIHFGGTMSLGGVYYNEASTFATKERADEYVNTAIAKNIQHSLRCYQQGGHFRSLQELYEANELTSAINRVVEDVNHRFTLEVLTRDFVSHDLSISARNLRSDRTASSDILDRVDVPTITARLRELLEIRNYSEQSVMVSETAAKEIEEYLSLLDLIQYVDVISMTDLNHKASRHIISQPGLRYAQADALVSSLLEDATFAELSLKERNTVCERIRSEIKGRMMEDIILLETKLAYPRKEVFVLQFPIGEFDMVVFDPKEANCQIYEIKHSTERVPAQYRHLVDEDQCAQTRHRYGDITLKTVLYRGETTRDGKIQYQNVEEYLRTLPYAP